MSSLSIVTCLRCERRNKVYDVQRVDARSIVICYNCGHALPRPTKEAIVPEPQATSSIKRDPKELHAEFNELARPLIKWLNDNYHPHAVAIIAVDSAAVMEGHISFSTDDFIKD